MKIQARTLVSCLSDFSNCLISAAVVKADHAKSKKKQPMMCLMLTFRSRELGAQNDAKNILKRVASLTEHLIVACIVHSGRAWILQGIFMVFSFQFPFASLEALKPPRHLPRQIFTWMDSIRSLAMLWILTLFAHFPQLLSITAPQKKVSELSTCKLAAFGKKQFCFLDHGRNGKLDGLRVRCWTASIENVFW